MEEMQLSDVEEKHQKASTPSTGDVDEATYLDVPLLPNQSPLDEQHEQLHQQ